MSAYLLSNIFASRRSALLGAGALSAASLLPGCSQAKQLTGDTLDLTDPIDNLYAFGKIWGGFDGPVIGSFHGLMYARIGNVRMIPVFGFAGTGVLESTWDPAGRLSVRSRETAFFTDLATGEVLERWDNPFTGESVDVYHFYNHMNASSIGTVMPQFLLGESTDSPTIMNEGTVFPDPSGTTPFLMPTHRFGEDLMVSWDYTHDYTNPVTPEGWPKASVGPRITPSEHFTFSMNYDDVINRDIPSNRMIAGFSRQSNWWPWMRMGGSKYQDGVLFGRMFSHKGLPGTGDVYPPVLRYLEKHAPEFLEMPDDLREDVNRLDVSTTYAQDVPPENPDYDWVQKRPDTIPAPPTGLGSKF